MPLFCFNISSSKIETVVGERKDGIDEDVKYHKYDMMNETGYLPMDFNFFLSDPMYFSVSPF